MTSGGTPPGLQYKPNLAAFPRLSYFCGRPPIDDPCMVGETLSQSVERHRNPSTPRAINNHNNFLKTIGVHSLVLQILFYNSTFTD